MEELKFCKDCKHYKPAWSAYGYGNFPAKCSNPKNANTPDLVDGVITFISTPWELREPKGNCGPDGAWFEAKEPEPELKREPENLFAASPTEKPKWLPTWLRDWWRGYTDEDAKSADQKLARSPHLPPGAFIELTQAEKKAISADPEGLFR